MTSNLKPTSSHRNRSFNMQGSTTPPGYESEPKVEENQPPHRHREHRSPFQHYPGQRTKWVKPEGESNRRGVHPLKFLKLCFISSNKVSMAVNVLWPVVPAAIAVHFARPDWNLVIFILNYIAMVPAANLIGYAGQELARKLPKVFGVLLETTLGSLVEIILFIVLISRGDNFAVVVKAAILGSILANLLLCLGVCFAVGGLRDHDNQQSFHAAISEVGTGLMLVAGMGLVVPTIFSASLSSSGAANITATSGVGPYETEVLNISRAVAIMLLCAFVVYVIFQMRSNHGLYDDIFEQDELRDRDRTQDLNKEKLTFTECILALLIALACVALIAVFLVEQIEYLVQHRGVSDAFLGLILVPLVEKAAEHLTAVDEAWDNQMNFALSHVLGASLQTALLNTPIVVIVGWGLGRQMDLNFHVFDAVVLILAILVVGNFLRDGKSNYLEGFLCVIVYIMIAVSAFYYPNPEGEGESGSGSEPSSEGGGESTATATEAARLAVRTAAALMGVGL